MNFYQFNASNEINPQYRWHFLVEIDSKLMYLHLGYREKREWYCTSFDKRNKTNYIGSL